MVGQPYQNYDIVYVGFFAAYNRLSLCMGFYLFLSHIQPFITRIKYAYKCKIKCTSIRGAKNRIYAYLSKPTYTRAKSVCIRGVQKSDLV